MQKRVYLCIDACGEQTILKVEFTLIYALAFRLPVLRSDMPMLVSKISFCGTIFWYRYFLLVMNVETDAFQVGTFNSTGQRFKGHYSIWLTNEIHELLSPLEHCLIDPILLTGWVNGNLYERTNEVAGVLPIPADIRGKSGMAQFEPSLHSKQRHRYLAALQGTRKPVLPVHSTAEKELFRDLMAKNPASFSTPSNIDNFVRLWNSHADQDKDISYKVRIPLISVMSLTKLSVV